MSGRHVNTDVDKISRKLIDFDEIQFLCGRCKYLGQQVIDHGKQLYVLPGKKMHSHFVTAVIHPPWTGGRYVDDTKYARLCEQLILKKGKHTS